MIRFAVHGFLDLFPPPFLRWQNPPRLYRRSVDSSLAGFLLSAERVPGKTQHSHAKEKHDESPPRLTFKPRESNAEISLPRVIVKPHGFSFPKPLSEGESKAGLPSSTEVYPDPLPFPFRTPRANVAPFPYLQLDDGGLDKVQKALG